MATTAIKDFVMTSTQEAMQFQQRFSSFTNLVEGDAMNFMSSLEEASNFTVSRLSLVTSANQALMLGLTQEQLPKMMEAARIMGAAVGRSTEEAFGDLALGIGRQSRMILDNLGIIVRVEEANRKYAESIGVSVSALTQQQKQLAFNEAATESFEVASKKLEGTIDAETEAVLQFNKAMTDLRVEVGGPLKSAFGLLLDDLVLTRKEMEEMTDLAELKPGLIDPKLAKLMAGIPLPPETGEGLSGQRSQEELISIERMRHEGSIQNLEVIIRLEETRDRILKEKDLRELDNLIFLNEVTKSLDEAKILAAKDFGETWSDVMKNMKSDAEDLVDVFRVGSSGTLIEEHQARRQEQIESGDITPHSTT